MHTFLLVLWLGCEQPEPPCEARSFFVDSDLDGFGGASVSSCSQPLLQVSEGGDCDDEDPLRHPDAEEVCDGVDNDCDGSTDPAESTDAVAWYPDTDRDGFGDPSQPTRACAAPDGHTDNGQDCDDTDSAIRPGAAETCDNGIDENCDGAVDEENGSVHLAWYRDQDGDGDGDPDSRVEACTQPSGYVSNNADCDDTDPSTGGGSEVCACGDGIDNDHDGLLDCEDGECVGHALCLELDCADGIDRDLDGLVDCADDDCWGISPCSLQAQVHGGMMRSVADRRRYSSREAYSTHVLVGTGSATSVSGVVTVLDGTESVFRCEWSLDRAAWAYSSVWAYNTTTMPYSTMEHSNTPGLVARSGFRLSADCPLTLDGSDILPDHLNAKGDVVRTSFHPICLGDWYASRDSSSLTENYSHSGATRTRRSWSLGTGEWLTAGRCD